VEGGKSGMSGKMPERTRAIIVNVGIVIGLIGCYFEGYSPTILLISGALLLAFANTLMYFKRRQISK
jgi:tetrahydromethanopterin S-methyltransferase subunit C